MGKFARLSPLAPPVNASPNRDDCCRVALLLIDLINDLEFPEGESLRPHVEAAAEHAARLKRRARSSNDTALDQMELFCKAETPTAAAVDFEDLKRRDADACE